LRHSAVASARDREHLSTVQTPTVPSPAAKHGRGGDRTSVAAALAFVVALAVRATWLLVYQRPADGVFSDMAGYVARAQALLQGHDDETCFPPGTHWFYAAQMALWGPDGLGAMGWAQVVLGASLAPLSVLLARRVSGSVVAAAVVGGLVALWHPLVTFGGYFSSELPFAVALLASVLGWVRWQQTARGGVLTGVAMGFAYLIRPTALLAFALLFAWACLRGLGSWRGRLSVLAPVLLAILLGAARYHDRTGRWGLISDNGAVASFFAWTDYLGLQATPPPGAPVPIQRGFHPPSRNTREFLPDYTYTGLRCDPAPLLAERNRVIAASSATTLAARVLRNVTSLFRGNPLWPERTRATEGFRQTLQTQWPWVVTAALLPLSGLGLVCHLLSFWSPHRPELRAARTTVALCLLSAVLAAAAYTGEVRYRVPYDPLLLVFAVYGVGCVVGWLRGLRGGEPGTPRA
jgi:hypothetical protein